MFIDFIAIDKKYSRLFLFFFVKNSGYMFKNSEFFIQNSTK